MRCGEDAAENESGIRGRMMAEFDVTTVTQTASSPPTFGLNCVGLETTWLGSTVMATVTSTSPK
jgi:hypothetical protein